MIYPCNINYLPFLHTLCMHVQRNGQEERMTKRCSLVLRCALCCIGKILLDAYFFSNLLPIFYLAHLDSIYYLIYLPNRVYLNFYLSSFYSLLVRSIDSER